ncbi:HEPN domain-containing protein [Vibrio parahaemolyticus]
MKVNIPEQLEIWVPSQGNKKIRSSFIVENYGGCSIKPEENFSDEGLSESVLHAELDDGRLTIFDANYRTKTNVVMGGGECKSTLFSSIFIVGPEHLEELDKLKVKEFSCDLVGVDEWFCENHFFASQKYLNITKVIEKVFSYKNDYELNIKYKHDFTTGRSVFNLTISSSLSSFLLTDFQNAFYSLASLISFSIGGIVTPSNITVINSENKKYFLSYEPSFRSELERKVKKPPLFFIHDLTQDIVNKWEVLSENELDLMKLYFLPMKYKLDLSTSFIIYSQFAEAIHRKISNENKMYYIDRLKEITKNPLYYKNFKNENIDKLCNELKNSRNYYTHYNQNEKYKAFSGNDIIFKPMKLHLFIDLYLLAYLGFRDDYFDRIEEFVIYDRLKREEVLKTY